MNINDDQSGKGPSLDGPPNSELLEELWSHAWATMDFLDSGIFAPQWVIDLAPDEMVAAFAPVSADLDLVRAHDEAIAAGSPGLPGCCLADGIPQACPALTAAIQQYRALRQSPGHKPTFMLLGRGPSLPTPEAIFERCQSLWDGGPY